MTIENSIPLIYSNEIERPLEKYDNNLARKIFLMKKPENKQALKEKLDSIVLEFNRQKQDLKNFNKKIDNKIISINTRIEKELSKNFFTKLIEAIQNYFLNTPSPLETLRQSKTKCLTRKEKSSEALNTVDLGLRQVRVYLRENPNLDTELEEAQQQILKDLARNFQITVNGKKCTDVNVFETLQDIGPKNKLGQYTLLRLSTQTLPILLKNATMDLLNQRLKTPSSAPQYIVKDVSKNICISIDQNTDGTLIISLATEYQVTGPRSEFFHLKSKIHMRLSEEGVVQNALVSNAVLPFPTPRNILFSPRIVDRHYKTPPVNEKEYAQVTLKDSEDSLWVSQDFQRDCDRQINHLHIKGIGTLTRRHQGLLNAISHVSKQLEEENRVYAQRKINEQTKRPIAEELEELKTKLRQDVLHDFLRIITEKLGPNRMHLIPQLTYLFSPASAGPLQEIIHNQYHSLSDQTQLDTCDFTLDIPLEENDPITITCKGRGSSIYDKRGKIDRFDITTKGVYSIHLDGHTAFDGSVSQPHSIDLLGFF